MALAFGGACEEIVLLDTDLEKARASAMDAADACLFTPGSCTVHVGNYDDCKTADIIVISVGQPRKPGKRGWTCWTIWCVCSGMCAAT